jgi:hypothetical protein
MDVSEAEILRVTRRECLDCYFMTFVVQLSGMLDGQEWLRQ